MAQNTYIVVGGYNQQVDRFSDTTDILFLRSSANTWVQTQNFYLVTNTASGSVLGWLIGNTAPVSGTTTYNLIFGGTATFNSASETATAGASNGNLDDYNSALTFDIDRVSIAQMNTTAGQLQSASNGFSVEFRRATTTTLLDP